VALLHPERIWVETLEGTLRSLPEIEVVVANPLFHWTHDAVARGDVDVVLIGLDHETFDPEHVRQLREARPGVGVVILCESRDPELLAGVVRAGARGWLPPTVSVRQLVRTLQGVTRGQAWLPPDLTTVLLDELLRNERTRATSQEAIAKLSAREVEILDCLARGMTREEIGEEFQLSPHTVRTHVNHVLRKLGVHSTLAAVSLANRSRPPR
jgi:DNA-binding NarL/FixJ family response regulator